MTLGVGLDLLHRARAQQCAIVAAVVYDIVGLESIAAAGTLSGQPVIAQVGSSAFSYADRRALIAAAISVATEASGPVGLHLDHSRDLDEVRACLDAGYSSVMIDGSRLELAENIALTRRAAELAHPYGAWVEGELGHITGDENRSIGAARGAMTDPRQVARYVEESGVDALAVCIGNVHGRTTAPVTLDLALLAEIASTTAVPLVLHGASGVSPDVLSSTVQRGVAKLNINADLRAAALAAIATHQTTDPAGDDLPGALTTARHAMTSHLTQLIERVSPAVDA